MIFNLSLSLPERTSLSASPGAYAYPFPDEFTGGDAAYSCWSESAGPTREGPGLEVPKEPVAPALTAPFF